MTTSQTGLRNNYIHVVFFRRALDLGYNSIPLPKVDVKMLNLNPTNLRYWKYFYLCLISEFVLNCFIIGENGMPEDPCHVLGNYGRSSFLIYQVDFCLIHLYF